jgi:selenocysteine lyase/cysteine desulfurase
MNPGVFSGAPLDRSDFDLPSGTAYLNAGAYGPLSRLTLEAGTRAMMTRVSPVQFDKASAAADIERARASAAALIGARSQDVAVVSSISHAAAIAAATLSAPLGSRVLRLAGEHPSNVLPWVAMTCRGCVEEIVPEPADGDWTSAVLEAIERPGAAPLAVATFAPYHWSDGACLDLDRVIPAVRRKAGAVFIDATHAIGVDPMSVAQHRPDFLAFPLFKWLMGPYGMAFVYVDPEHHGGEPTDRSATNSLLTPELAWKGFAEGARRYDRGERDDPVSAAMAAASLAQIHALSVEAIAARIGPICRALAEVVERAGIELLPSKNRAPHVLGLRFAAAGRAAEIVKILSARGVIVSERRGVMRITPHLYNDMSDVECFSSALASALRT